MALFETDSAVGVFCQLPRVGAEGGQLHGLDSATLRAGEDAVNTACRETPTSRWLQRRQIAGKMLPMGNVLGRLGWVPTSSLHALEVVLWFSRYLKKGWV